MNNPDYYPPTARITSRIVHSVAVGSPVGEIFERIPEASRSAKVIVFVFLL